MNWRVSALDRYTLVSNSDTHSSQKLAREANLFDTELSYPAIFKALQTGDPTAFRGTIEFFPEEGKYHLDGHRKCSLRWEPKTTIAHNGLCAECGKPVTVGVTHRVETLADRPGGGKPARYHPFQSLIPLPEILSEVYQVGPNSKRVKQQHESLLAKLGPELPLLLEAPLEEIEQAGGSLLAEGIRRMRRNEVNIAAGYDGEFGVIKLFEEEERDALAGQLSLFAPPKRKRKQTKTASSPTNAAPAGETGGEAQWNQSSLFGQAVFERPQEYQPTSAGEAASSLLAGLNPQQREAALTTDDTLIIVAGPGTGKTRTLTYRIAHLIADRGVPPEHILAITFTNKAAEEMATRLTGLLEADVAGRVVIKTFHALGAMILRENGQYLGLSPNFTICSDDERQAILKQCYPIMKNLELSTWLEQISAAKNQLQGLDAPELSDEFADIYDGYETTLVQQQTLDFDDLIVKTVRLFESRPDILESYQRRFCWISVDEYQDVNHGQYRLLRLLTGPESNLCVIGDPDQAIYGFRGASWEYFLKFQEDYPEARTIHLSQNYRSTQLILDASGQVIAKNPADARVAVWSEFLDKTKLDIYHALTDKAEAEYTNCTPTLWIWLN